MVVLLVKGMEVLLGLPTFRLDELHFSAFKRVNASRKQAAGKVGWSKCFSHVLRQSRRAGRSLN